ncbi:hypothetical protein TVAG_198980 [Trichomonas vaginalis G3]|uniref:phosphatidyl-N-methylethanolamine N-methyltransferase n=1 Tax=Trichomonas vaginalis (strain ATCC PRA-98 / G3) TaxID=412133 RepID=A2DDT3_TRIV3|nr:phosphatidylethanolamine N-methyltransferase family [Trichomonas vaginalis G3]EAY21459.1 hypothetical protein TVAG_198980 [Trichomonas vaginalis G3]KAI5490672.1 phosphatidylethanolamine N-methyltransferase family [Trichomonas vaginalis G3]|eukprot:XP_001582445.1 hypothetical protein [Trichomonas vaginalis G3]
MHIDFSQFVCIFTTLFPYFLYTCAYKFPNTLSKIMTQKTLIQISTWNKIIGAVFHLPTCFRAGINGPGLCIAIPLVFVGQYLNEVVYNVLGDSGVYYGNELKTSKPKNISGFPFTMGDPMYKGAILTVLGWFFAMNTTRDIIIICVPWMIAYFTQVIIENTAPGA